MKDELFAVAFDGAEIHVDTHKSLAHVLNLDLCHLERKKFMIKKKFSKVFLNLPRYSLVAAAAIAISSSRLLGLQLVVFQCVRNPDALIYFLSQP